MAEEDDPPPKRKFRLTLEEKNTIPADPTAISEYIGSNLGFSLPAKSVKPSKKHCIRLLSRFDFVILIVQSATIGQVYAVELADIETHIVCQVLGKAAKVERQAIQLAGAKKSVAIGSPAALKTILELGGLRIESGKTVVAIDGRTNSKGYNIFTQKSEQGNLLGLLETIFQKNARTKCVILSPNLSTESQTNSTQN